MQARNSFLRGICWQGGLGLLEKGVKIAYFANLLCFFILNVFAGCLQFMDPAGHLRTCPLVL
jgi:hypothetical protein